MLGFLDVDATWEQWQINKQRERFPHICNIGFYFLISIYLFMLDTENKIQVMCLLYPTLHPTDSMEVQGKTVSELNQGRFTHP